MRCPKCKKGKGYVQDIANVKDTDEVLRRRRCNKCNYEYVTIEYEVERDETFNKSWKENYR